MNLRPLDHRRASKNPPKNSKPKKLEEKAKSTSPCNFTLKIPKLDENVYLYYMSENDQMNSENKTETPKKPSQPLFRIKESENNPSKKVRRPGKSGKAKVKRKTRMIEQLSSDKKVLQVKTPNKETTSLPNIKEAQIVEDEYDKPQNSSQNFSIFDSNLSSTLDEVAFTEGDLNLETVDVKINGITDEELKLKLKRRLMEMRNSNVSDNNAESSSDSKKGDSMSKLSLRQLVENFLSSPQIGKVQDSDFLKRGLCSTWLKNKYDCSNPQCIYSHNASKLFSRKLKSHPSKFVLILVASMRNDDLFVDVILAAFKVLTQRKIPVLWITFLIYFVFYVTEPSDRRFLKFWANAARFFCQLKPVYGAANGFASLLCIFSQGEECDDWKIIEFIKVIQKPPIELRITYALLNPILEKKLPTWLLTAAVESAIETQVDPMKVYLVIIPKISLKNLPIDGVEVLLKFCLTLEGLNENQSAKNLRQRLIPKVQQFKIKIKKEDFPLTATLQEELYKCPKNSYTAPLENSADLEEKLKLLASGNDYFEPKKQFFDEIIQAVDLSSSKLPPAFQTSPKPNNSSEVTFSLHCEEKITREEQIEKVIFLFSNQQFDGLGKYLNELRNDAQLVAAENILKLLLQMKISLQQVVDLIKLMICFCKNENAAKVLASISVTLVLNLVKIGEWDKAYILASACLDKEINIIEATVFVSQEFISFTHLKIALVVVELYLFKKNFRSALEFVKKYWLYSPNRTRWKLNWKESDEIIRVKILEEFLRLIILDHSTELVYELFVLISREQKEVHRPIDLNNFASDVFSLLLNQNPEEAVFFFDKVKLKFNLNDNVIRTILVSLVRQKRHQEAKNLMFFYNQSIYVLPQITFGVINAKILSSWLEEEIYIYFDCVFDLLFIKKTNKGFFGFSSYGNFEIYITISTEETIVPTSVLPLCLTLIDSSYESAFARIQRVLRNKFTPSLSIIDNFDSLKLDDDLLRLFINNRFGSA